jgi:aminoglycoside/choline kinase family phosphotransferase
MPSNTTPNAASGTHTRPVRSNTPEAASDVRLTQLKAWLAQQTAPFVQADTLRPASTDASFRRYFRVDGRPGDSAASDAAAPTFIAMDAPPPQEDVQPFIKVAGIFGGCGLSTPKVLAQDVERGFLLLSDLGATTYLHQLNVDTAHQLYMDAIDALILLQAQSQPDVLPEYDRPMLLRELNLFPEWYIGKHLGISLDATQNAALNKVFDAILANNLAQAQVYVHRDYHSRNLMVCRPNNPGVLDFQDAVYGPITYDLASLLRDAYIQWDEEMVLDWVIRYWEKAKRAGLPVNPDIDAFYRDFEYMGLQRHLKVLGIFARLYHRDGKDGYLNDLPLVREYVRKTAARYTELKPLLRLMDVLEDKKPGVGYTF